MPAGNPDGIAVDAATGTDLRGHHHQQRPEPDLSVQRRHLQRHRTTAGAARRRRCSRSAIQRAGSSALSLAVNQATNTIYATNVVTSTVPFCGDNVYVINGATCDAANSTGCGQTPPAYVASKVRVQPLGNRGGPGHDTIYTANIADGEHPGTVSVINGATCNGSDHHRLRPDPRQGRGRVRRRRRRPIDPATNTVYVANVEDTSVTVINGATCNGSDTSGCAQTMPKVAVGNYPSAITVDPAAGTAYVTNGDNTVSVIRTTRHPAGKVPGAE